MGYGFLFYSNFVLETHRFWESRLRKMSWPWNPGQRSPKVIGTDTYRSATCDFLLTTSHSNHGPVSHRFRDKRRFQSKIAIFPTPCILRPADGVPLGIGYRRKESQTRVMGLPGRTRSLTTSSAVWMQSTNMTDRQTDGRTPDDSKDRAYA